MLNLTDGGYYYEKIFFVYDYLFDDFGFYLWTKCPGGRNLP